MANLHKDVAEDEANLRGWSLGLYAAYLHGLHTATIVHRHQREPQDSRARVRSDADGAKARDGRIGGPTSFAASVGRTATCLRHESCLGYLRGMKRGCGRPPTRSKNDNGDIARAREDEEAQDLLVRESAHARAIDLEQRRAIHQPGPVGRASGHHAIHVVLFAAKENLQTNTCVRIRHHGHDRASEMVVMVMIWTASPIRT